MIFNTDIIIEEKLLLLLSNPFLTEDHRNEVQAIISNNNINYKKIYSLALNNGVAGFVYKNSQTLNIFPDEISFKLHRFYRQTALRNILIFRETLTTLKLRCRSKNAVN